MPNTQTIIGAFWQEFLRSKQADMQENPPTYEAWGFGNTPVMADNLGNLVRQGIKTATASLMWSYEAEVEPLPQVRDYSIILDGQDLPLCIIRTTRLDVIPFNEVDAEHAYLEGEGDRSLAYWREVHWKFFSEECQQIDRQPEENMPVLCERFELVYV